jgi:hypothetical protein
VSNDQEQVASVAYLLELNSSFIGSVTLILPP